MTGIVYQLNLDGPLLLVQRRFLLGLGAHLQVDERQAAALDGLTHLLKCIAEQAHEHGTECLFETEAGQPGPKVRTSSQADPHCLGPPR